MGLRGINGLYSLPAGAGHYLIVYEQSEWLFVCVPVGRFEFLKQLRHADLQGMRVSGYTVPSVTVATSVPQLKRFQTTMLNTIMVMVDGKESI